MTKLIFFLLSLSLQMSLCKSTENQTEDISNAVHIIKASDMVIDTTWQEKTIKTNSEWKKILTPEQYHITREQGTEKPFSSPLYEVHDEGYYLCISCKNPLFHSSTKFNSGTGWPSFYAPYFSRSVHVSMDDSHGMVRDEISCARCDAHLGHVFNDGPKPTGLRYCMDGFAMEFVSEKQALKSSKSKVVLAAGCFWCMEAIFEKIKGVHNVISGYAGGKEKNPSYDQVGSGATGHAEAIEVEYDPAIISFKDLVRVFFASQDPTQVNGQGPDHGTQYRSIAFYSNDGEKKIIEDYIDSLTKSGKFKKLIASELLPVSKFWKAEDYHQDYVKNHPENPYVQHESIPRMKRALEQLKDLVQ